MTSEDGEAAPQPVKSAGRALEIIDHLAANGAASFNDIVADLALPKSSAHGLIRTLEAAGWIAQERDSRRFTLGLRAWQVGQQYDGHRRLAEVAKPIMEELTGQTGETVQLARLDGVENVYIAISPSPNPMRLASTVGMRLHAHATGIGKALLSTLPPDEVRRRLSAVALPRLTERTETDIDALVRIVEWASQTGYAIDDEEFIPGCRCVAVPVTTEEETGIVSAMSITTPTQRVPAGWPYTLYEPLARAAGEIRRGMGLAGSLAP